MTQSTPRDHYVQGNGLRHHVLEWGTGDRIVVLLHGFLDLAYAFDPLASRLAERGFHVYAADARGHGETDWVGAGGYYYFPDYLLDLEAWTSELGLDAFHLVGHSMGGTVATMFAGVRPMRVRALVSIEGLGPPEQPLEAAPARYGRWLEGVTRSRGRVGRPIASTDEAFDRMREMHRKLPEAFGRALAERATKPHPTGEGLAWRYDPLHRTESPIPYNLGLHRALMARIEARTLIVLGERGMRLADEKERIAMIRDARTFELAGVGHMLHWEAPDDLATRLVEHFDADCGGAPSDAELSR